MLQSNLIKLIFSLVILAFPAGLAEAKPLRFAEQTWNIEPALSANAPAMAVRTSPDLKSVINSSVFGESTSSNQPLLSPATIAEIEKIAAELNQPPKSPRLIIENNRATTFEPPQNGQTVDLYLLVKQIQNPLESEVPVLISEPPIKLSDTNSLGINELVAVGESDFSGSPNNRIVNIRVGAAKFNGLIIKPGEEFSFNKFLGDVDAEHGFLPELVIKPGGLVPEFGGGLCQVSSTVFRAAMNAGFPIKERRNHSFAVRYYAPQGTDATIYPGVTDMRFVNDSGGHMLIRTKIVGGKLYFEFYGSKDDRKVAFEGPRQYDKKSDGSLKATWTRHVTINGQTTTQTFNSVYRPPALYPRESTTQPATPNPQTPTPPENQTPPPPLTPPPAQ